MTTNSTTTAGTTPDATTDTNNTTDRPKGWRDVLRLIRPPSCSR